MSRLTDYSKFDRIVDTDDDDDEHDEISSNDDSELASTTPASSILSSSTHMTTDSDETEAKKTARAGGLTQKHPAIPNRYIFSHTGQKVYEWEQSLEEVILYIDAPPHLLSQMQNGGGGAAKYILVDISPTRLRVGLVGSDRYFIDEMTFDKVKIKESSWYIDDDDGDGVITIILAKCYRGQTWEGVLRGHDNRGTIDAAAGVNSGTTTIESSGGKTLHETINPYVKQEMQRTMMLERFQEENPGFDFRDATFNGEVPDPRSFMGGVGYNH